MNNFNDFMYPNRPIMPQNPNMNAFNPNILENNFTTENNQNLNNNNVNSLGLVDSYEGYTRGNMFQNLYSEYQNYRPQRLVGKNKQQQQLLQLGEVAFAAHDLNLYLDNFPNDKEAIQKFNEYRRETNRLMEEYENTYGPLVISSNSLNTIPWAWSSRFPWEVSK